MTLCKFVPTVAVQNDNIFITAWSFIPLNNPVFENSAISYSDGILKSSDSTVTRTRFIIQTGRPGFELRGTMHFTYLEAETYTISGQVTYNGTPLSDVTITPTVGAPALTNDAGEYSITVLENSTVTITPSLEGYTFEPENIIIEDIIEDIVRQDFMATAISEINSVQSSFFTMYPNPAKGSVTISGVGLARVEIYDIQGRKYAEYTNLKGILYIDDLKKYENGIYFVKMHSECGYVVVQRLEVGG